MREIACYILPVIIVFCLIGIIESAMLFEKTGEDISSLNSNRTTAENKKGKILWKF